MTARQIDDVVGREDMRAIVRCQAVVPDATIVERDHVALVVVAVVHRLRVGVDDTHLEAAGEAALE
jgi:hypothetical protein